jgi:hypothetical protein
MTKCPPDTFSSTDGSYCSGCTPGSHCTTGAAIPCDPGYYNNGTTTICHPCEKGSFQSNKGATSCLFCPEGFYSDAVARTKCEPCKVGHECPYGSKIPVICKEGDYAEAREGHCSPCLQGHYCSQGVMKACAVEKGFFAKARQSSCLCRNGFYRKNTTGTSDVCVMCDDGMECEGRDGYGTDIDSLKARNGSYLYKDEVRIFTLKCQPETACVNNNCSVRHRNDSFLCSQCNDKYFLSGSIQSPLDCQLCKPARAAIYGLVITAALIGGLVLLAFLVRKKILRLNEVVSLRAKAHSTRINTPPSQPPRNGGVTPIDDELISSSTAASVLQRSAVNHLQILGLLGRLNFQWPSLVRTLFRVAEGATSLSVLSSLQMVSLDESIKCGLYSSSTPLPMNEMIVDTVSLLITAAIVLLFWAIRMCYKQQERTKVFRKIVISLITLFYLSYSKILRDLFQLFDCAPVSPLLPERRLRGALDVVCDLSNKEYRYYIFALALPVILLLLIPLPVVSFMTLRKADRASDDVYKVYGFLYDGYKTEYWYWEICVLLRKILIAAITVFGAVRVASVTDSSSGDTAVDEDQYQQGLFASLVMGVALFFQMMFQPYEGEAMNKVEVMGLTVGFLSLYLGLWTFHAKEWKTIIVTVLIFTLNIGWVVYVFVALYKEYEVAKFLVSMWNYCACRNCQRKTGYTESIDEGEAGGTESQVVDLTQTKGGRTKEPVTKEAPRSWLNWWGRNMAEGSTASKTEGKDVELAVQSRTNEVLNPLSSVPM